MEKLVEELYTFYGDYFLGDRISKTVFAYGISCVKAGGENDKSI